jgi:hypothetical protein
VSVGTSWSLNVLSHVPVVLVLGDGCSQERGPVFITLNRRGRPLDVQVAGESAPVVDHVGAVHTARIQLIVHVHTGDVGEDRLEGRVPLGSGHVLGDAEVRASIHPHVAVTPGLRREPLDHLTGIVRLRLREESLIGAERRATTPDLHRGHDVPVLDEEL